MNRRKFFGAMIAPVGAIVAAKTLPVGYVESARTKLMRWFKPRPSLQSKFPSGLVHHAPQYSTSMYEMNAHRMHQEMLSKWLANKVDEAAFNTIRKANEQG